MKTVTDHLGRSVQVPKKPTRIISICPAITSTIFEFGAGETVVGRTEYCIFPKDKVEQVSIVGGTKQVDFERIRELNPDLIVAEKEENTKVIVNTLAKEFPVFVFEVQSIEQNERFIRDVGELVDKQEEAADMLEKVQTPFAKLPKLAGKKAAYMIWQEPYMVVGHHTFINSVLAAMELKNPFIDQKSRYPIIQFDQLKAANLDYLLLASEPFHFTEEHRDAFQAQLPNTKVLNVDGEMFWYGSQSVPGSHYMPTIFENDQPSGK